MKTLKLLIMTAIIASGISGKATNPELEELVKYAVKAPSGHNTQPWKFYVYDSAIEVFPDFQKTLPVVDSEHRELYISLGCAVENLCIAAREKGFQPEATIRKKNDTLCTIYISLKKTQTQTSPLFSAIEKRQTNRSEYNHHVISRDTIQMLQDMKRQPGTHFYLHENGSKMYEALSGYIFKGNKIQMQTKAFKKELISWIRFNKKHVEQTQNGLTNEVMGTPAVPPFLGKMIVSAVLTPKNQNKTDKKHLGSSSHLALFTTENNTPKEWIELGRTLERFLLKTTHLGIANAYMNQPCEVDMLAEEMQANLTENNEYPTLLLRIGYADPMPYSPRKDVESVIYNQADSIVATELK